MPVKMHVVGITVDSNTNAPIVVLRDEEGEKILPIWIGILEASSIATQLEKVELARPMTHDLFINLLRLVGLKLNKIIVTDLQDNTYYARIFFADNKGKEFDIDARPSDSLALALRAEAEIFVNESVLEKATLIDKKVLENARKTMDEKWKEILENIDPDDLGKYRA